jgi:predicted CXXCH cytochrome family protein
LRWRFGIFFLLPIWGVAQTKYLGREVCAGCHKAIAATQLQTAMALTWQGTTPRQVRPDSQETQTEGPNPAINYFIRRTDKALSFEVRMPGQMPLQFPIEVTMGGLRHGTSFLARVADLDGLPLARAPLVETRYLHYAPRNHLELSPGFPKDKPTTYETAIGRVLTPHFEEKCLACHGAPASLGSHLESGVTCESCHGAGQAHLKALASKSNDKAILNPGKLPIAEQMKPCSRCHAGFSNVVDPMPDDLLISDQVRALSNSECWRQSAGQITCVNCHNPHQDLPRGAVVAKSEKTCVSCHSESGENHRALCPVSRARGCVGCHMPDSKHNAPFVISDHWIRVHPEQNAGVPASSTKWASKVVPKHLFLRLMVFDDATKASAIRGQLASGGSFFELARANSVDRASAMNGGYLGDLDASALDPAWAKAALSLRPGEVSPVITAQGRYFIVGRMPRNFREEAEARFNHAMELRKGGDRQATAAELLEALKIDPQLLRALTYLGVTYAESGNPQVGAGVLGLATRLYPQDAGAHFNLGVAYGAMGKSEEIDEYKKALTIDPDYVPAHLNWGGALFLKGQYDEAIRIYREGINVNPLEASLHYSLSLALERENKSQEAQAEKALAAKIDPRIGERQ